MTASDERRNETLDHNIVEGGSAPFMISFLFFQSVYPISD